MISMALQCSLTHRIQGKMQSLAMLPFNSQSSQVVDHPLAPKSTK